MKKTIKLIPAALALLAFASCSNDELFGEKTIEVSSQYQLAVEAENTVEAGTRAGHVIMGKAREVVWQAGDVIRTYDDALGNFDEYANTTTTASLESSFGLTGATTPALSSHKYAVFPSDYVNTLGWGKVEDKKMPILTMDIPTSGIKLSDNFGKTFTQDGEEYAIGGLYLPMWGPVKEGTETAEKPEVKVSYMTAFLQVNLNAIPAPATKLILYAPNGEPLSGRFEAALDASDPTSAVLKAVQAKYQYSNKIEVDLQGTGVAGQSGSIYLPVIAEQQYKNLLLVAIIADKPQVIANYGPAHTSAAADATALGVLLADLPATIATTTPTKWIDTATPTKYIAKLGGKLIATEGFTLPRKQAVVCDANFAIAATCAYPSDITTTLVTYGSASKLEIDIQNSVPIECSAANYLVTIPEALKDADIVLNINNGITFAGTSPSDIVFKGTCKSLKIYMGGNITNTGNKGFDFTQVTGDVILDAAPAVVTAGKNNFGYVLGQNKETSTLSLGNITTANAFDNVTGHSTNGKSPLIIRGAYNKDITSAADVTVLGKDYTGNITVTGKANVDFIPGSLSTATVSNSYDYNGTITVAEGDVTYNNLSTTAATIVKTKAGSVDLKNGNINLTLTGNDGAVSVTSSGISEIGTFTASAEATASVEFNSVWDVDLSVAANVTALGNITAATNIYTAAQLAKGNFTAPATLKTNITSFTKAWSSVALTKNFSAKDVKITGLNAPLFKSVAANITNVTIEKAAITDAQGNTGFGVLAADVTGDATITGVNVSGSIASATDKALNYAGGLIGKVTGGTLVIGGEAEGTAVAVNVTFTNNGKLYGTSGRDSEAGTIGQIIGSINSTGAVNLKANCTATGAFDKSDAALKFSNYRIFNADYEIESYFKGESKLIGRILDTNTANVTIGATTYLATPDYTGLTYTGTTKTVTGTLYFIKPVAEATAKAAIQTAKSIPAADFAPTATPAVDLVTWNQVIKTLNSYVATAAEVQ